MGKVEAETIEKLIEVIEDEEIKELFDDGEPDVEAMSEEMDLDDISTIPLQPRKALVAGSFDPFTNGHLSIVRQAAEIFDEVHVVIFANSAKARHYPVRDMLDAIDTTMLFEELGNVRVEEGTGLLARYCAENGIRTNVRGVRDGLDWFYEENLREANALVNPELNTIYMRGDSKLSSTIVRDLFAYGEDISAYVPEAVLSLMQKQGD